MSSIDDLAITRGTGNVFEDLGMPDAAERQTKTHLAFAINGVLKARKLKQREVAALLGIPQPKVSALKNYRLDQFSVERLMEFLTALDHDVEIMIRPRTQAGAGHIAVLAVQ
ncbi:helix-turn-helix domain-containing protein [Nitrosovibrio sp. Nv17]|uniref:helix-turn-helix domain-containing protein n=1 Tax=Nitrosovibrio sp. Nv17 TaxID=1855339 RepID=UPI0009089D80|nr:helix-turn-helix transcriptional regulator [Nitrosovibrio sp. Nv17]SFW37186.1 Predicted DNA-binding protein, contains XRE-type HTH domain [Nitrosovibrio sp. Nv17]